MANFLPNVDDKILPDTVGATIRAGNAADVPILAGYNADEGSLFYSAFQSPTVLARGITGSLEEREQRLAEVFGENQAKALEALYGMDTLETWDEGATDMLGDDMFGVHMRFLGKANATAGNPTWMYFFTRATPTRAQSIGAYHGSEIPFVFGSASPLLPMSDKDEKLAETMQAYWTNFARTGDPNGPSLPEWPAYDPNRDEWQVLDHEILTVAGVRARKLDILEENLNLRLDRMMATYNLAGEDEGSALLSAPSAEEEGVADSDETR